MGRLVFVLTSPTTIQFSELFHWHILQKTCNKAIAKNLTPPKMSRYTTL